MTLNITSQGIITAAAVVTAIITLASIVFKARDWVKKKDGQGKEITALRAHHDEDITTIQDELQILTFGVLSCLKGLQEKGCNGPVTEAINRIEKHLNEKAHH